jgi:positive regulator of sigma E activity
VLVFYLSAIGLPLGALIALSFMDPWYAMASLVLPAAGWWIVQRGFVKWDGREVTGF